MISNPNWRWLVEGALHDDVDRLIESGGQCSHNFEEYTATWRKIAKRKPTEIVTRTYVVTFNLIRGHYQKQIKSIPQSTKKDPTKGAQQNEPKSVPMSGTITGTITGTKTGTNSGPNTPIDFQQVNTLDVGGNIDKDIEYNILSPLIPPSFSPSESIADGNYFAFCEALRREAPSLEGRNLAGLCINLQQFGVDRWEDFSDIVRATSYGQFGHPIWKVINDLVTKTWRPDNMVAYLKKHAHHGQ